MIESFRFKYLLLAILIFVLPSLAQKDSAVIKQLSGKADVILSGKVTQQESKWNASKTRIYTIATIQVEEYLKGSAGENSVEVTYPGGEVDGVGEIYTHMPTFHNNEEVLVFLKKDNRKNEYRVVNGEQGKITVFKDEKSGEQLTPSNIRIKNLKSQIKGILKKQ
jgi:hypothetical protein